MTAAPRHYPARSWKGKRLAEVLSLWRDYAENAPSSTNRATMVWQMKEGARALNQWADDMERDGKVGNDWQIVLDASDNAGGETRPTWPERNNLMLAIVATAMCLVAALAGMIGVAADGHKPQPQPRRNIRPRMEE